ncbi:MAG: hypothetical protein WCK02_07465 [Bacteroidota bacterium]
MLRFFENFKSFLFFRGNKNTWNKQFVSNSILYVIFFLLQLFYFQNAFAQADESCSATSLTVYSGSCSYTSATNVGATASSGIPAPGCASYSGTDVWYSIVVPSTGRLIISTEPGTLTDGGMAIYSGTCGSLSLIECDDDDGTGNMPMIDRSSLTVGNTLWIRVWGYSNASGTFTICALDGASTSNDEPCSASALTVSTGACSYTSGTNVGKTASSGVPAPGCASYSTADVWYCFVVPASGHVKISTEPGTLTDGGMAIYSGTCGSLTLIECDDDDGTGSMPMIDRTGLTTGNTIWVRVWGYGGVTGTFTICALDGALIANDDPCSATALTLSSGTCSYTSGTTVNSTTTTGPPAPGCGTFTTSDVWYSFVVPASGHVKISTEPGTLTDGGMAIYSGTCGSLTLIECDDDDGTGSMPMIDRTGLTVGNTIWVRVWGYSGATGTFTICALNIAPLTNDEPCNAITLTLSSGSCSYTSGTNEYSTVSSGPADPACSSGAYNDVWYKVVIPSTGHINISAEASSLTDAGMAIYNGTCGSLTLIECDDNDGTGSMPMIDRSGLVVGETIWIRVWGAAGATGTFSICALNVAPPANDEPVFATLLTLQTASNVGVSASLIGATASAGIAVPGCCGSVFNDVWYKIKVPISGSVTVSCESGTLSDAGMAIYSGEVYSSLTLVECDDDHGSGSMPMIYRSGLMPEAYVWVRLWGYNGSTGSFSILAVSNPIQPSCASNPVAGDLYTNPTSICNLNGFCGNTSATYTPDTPGDLMSSFCGTVENNSWLKFTADDDTARLNIWVSNCTNDNGIQMQIYDLDGTSFTPKSNCWNPGVPTNGNILATNLIIGHEYILMIDGNAGDVCDYLIGAGYGVMTAEATATKYTINSGESTTLNGSGGSTYSWSSNPVGFTSTSQNPIVSPIVTTTYSLTVTGGNPTCPTSHSDTVVVTVTAPLPVGLLSFETKCVGNGTKLTWQTISEVNNNYFKLEYSADLQTYSEIAIVSGSGNSNTLIQYAFLDNNQTRVIGYYRLIQFDFDGKSDTLSVINSLNCSSNEESKIVVANLNENGFSLISKSDLSAVQIRIYDDIGRLIPFSVNREGDVVHVGLYNSNKSSIYFLWLMNAGKNQIEKIIIP